MERIGKKDVKKERREKNIKKKSNKKIENEKKDRNFVHRRLRDRIFPNLADLDEDTRASKGSRELRKERIVLVDVILSIQTISTVVGVVDDDRTESDHESGKF